MVVTWKNIDPERHQRQKNPLKRTPQLLAVTLKQDNFPSIRATSSLKATTNNIDYHLTTTMFVTFPTKHYLRKGP